MSLLSWKTSVCLGVAVALGCPAGGAPPGGGPTRVGGAALPAGGPTRAGGTAPPGGAALPGGADPDAGKTVLYRDEYGVPHIYADTVEQGIYAVAYAQAEDRLEELLRNYLRATGEMSAAFGEAHVSDDSVARAWALTQPISCSISMRAVGRS